MISIPFEAILDSIPYPIVFVDTSHIIRYLNKRAKYHYYQERGYKDLVGKSVFDCHKDISKDKIIGIVERLANHEQEFFLKVSVRNERIYITPVRDGDGNLIGYYERFELNQAL
jgi:DUF438 domain-containing protein